MKTSTLTTLALLANLTFAGISLANEITLPVINKPAILEEGTQRTLTQSQINELLPWAKDSKLFLSDLLENIQGLSTTDKIERLAEGIANVVGESAPKNSELLMRYALNRGLVLNDILNKEMAADAVGTQDAKLRVLKSSIQIALKYYETDMAILARKSVAPFVIFGMDYFEFLNELNKSVFDASAQYTIQRTSLEWLQWDMYRDLNNASYAPQIVKINNGLKSFPSKKLTDAQSIAYIRQIKLLSGQLKVADTLKKLQLDKEIAAARTEAEKQAIIAKRQEELYKAERQRALEALNNGKPFTSSLIMSGDQVVHGVTLRTVQYVTDKQQVVLKSVQYSYAQEIVGINDVEKCASAAHGLKEGSTVLHENTIRNVTCIGEKGMVVLKSVQYLHAQTFAPINTVSLAVSAHQRFSIGDKVLYLSAVREVEYLDSNGRAVLKAVQYMHSRDFTTIDELSKVH